MASIQSKRAKSGKKTYYVVVSWKGKHKWIRAGTMTNAKHLKKQLESLEESQRMEKLGLSAREARIDDFFQKYVDHVRLHAAPSTVKRYAAVLNCFLVFLKMYHPGLRHLSQIKTEIVEDYQQKRLESVELKIAADGEKNGVHKNKKLPLPQTVNYEISVLRSVFRWAKDRELIAVIPTEKIKRLKRKLNRQAQILSVQECRHFLKTARDMGKEDQRLWVFYRAFKFILNSGLRSGELCNLTWDDVYLETGLIKIQPKVGWTPKTSSREFYLNDACLSVLRKIKERDGFVFKDHLGHQLDQDGLRKVLIRVAKAAGFDGFTRVHDLRHTFNSLMQMNGVDAATMGKILGHKDIETTMIYTHQTADHMKRAANRVRVG